MGMDITRSLSVGRLQEEGQALKECRTSTAVAVCAYFGTSVLSLMVIKPVPPLQVRPARTLEIMA